MAGPASATSGGPGGGGGMGGRAGGQPPSGAAPRGSSAGGPPASAAGGGGDAQVSSSLVSYLLAHQGSAKYLVAADTSHTTAPIIIQTGKAVVTIGGFNGADNAPTLAQLEAMVADGQLKYVLISGNGGGRGNSDIATWVTAHGTAVSGQSGLYLVTA
jgi:4-amino-4-deoxy-L-arabinose transferase-like glycosyltransferase